MSEVHGKEEEQEEFTEMILNHDGFILGRKRKRDSSPPPPLPPSMMMSEYTLNGHFLSIEIHETLVKDSEFYSSQIESGNDVFLSLANDCHMMEILLTFFQQMADAIRETRQYLIEAEIRWSKLFKDRHVSKVTLEKIYDHLMEQKSVKTYLMSLPLKDLYDFIEVLNFFMSKSFPLTVKVFGDIAENNPGVVDRIENWVEERTPSVLHEMEEKFLNWSLTLPCDLPRNTVPSFPYRFTDAVWIMLKIEMCAYHLVKTLSGCFLSSGAMAILRRLEPQTDFERQMVTNQIRFVTKIEMVEEGGRLTEFNEFCLKYCKLTYSDGCTYEGGVYIHPIGGPLRHGYGTIYEAQDESSDDEGIVIQEGKWLLNEFHCEIHVVCPCYLCNCDDDEEEDEDYYDDQDEVDDYMKCCFHIDRKEWNIDLDHQDYESTDYTYCTACKNALQPVKTRVDDEFLQMSNGEPGKTMIKTITTYKDYVDMFMPRN